MPKQRKPRQVQPRNSMYTLERSSHLPVDNFDLHSNPLMNGLDLLHRIPVVNGSMHMPSQIFQQHFGAVGQPSLQSYVPPIAPRRIQHQPTSVEPTYKGMSSDDFHLHVRARLEKVAEAALNRTNGEQEYRSTELLIKNRLRAAIEQQSTIHPACSVGTSPTPSASIFHTPSPSPTFRTCMPDQIAHQNRCPSSIVVSQTAQPVMIQQPVCQISTHSAAHYQMMHINNNVDHKYDQVSQSNPPYHMIDTPTQQGAYFMSTNATPTHMTPNSNFHSSGPFQIVQAHRLSNGYGNNQYILINQNASLNHPFSHPVPHRVQNVYTS